MVPSYFLVDGSITFLARSGAGTAAGPSLLPVSSALCRCNRCSQPHTLIPAEREQDSASPSLECGSSKLEQQSPLTWQGVCAQSYISIDPGATAAWRWRGAVHF